MKVKKLLITYKKNNLMKKNLNFNKFFLTM